MSDLDDLILREYDEPLEPMRHNTYFQWSELKPKDRFRVAGFDDLFQKLDETHAKCLGHGWTGSKATRMARKGQQLEFAANFGGLILAL